jgi:dTDP-4-amino-4,6-dideoxygalactose transaminase
MSSSFAVPYTDFPAQNAGVRDELRGAFDEVLDSGHYIQGPNVAAFEGEFAAFCEAPYATGVANGTCSLHLVLRSMGVGPGDEVITAPNSFFASAAAISLVGATIVFADVNEDSNLDPDAIEAAVTERTRAIMPVHLTGRPVDMVRIQAVADAHGLGILEDAAQAVGSSFRGQRVGSWGTAASFSLHPLKSLHAFGDAGIVTARDERIISDVALRKNHGLVDRGTCAEWSFNCRLDEVQAALLRVQLRNVDAKIAERRRLAHRYHDLLRDYVVVPEEREGEVHTYQTYLIQAGDRDALQAHLRANGVEAIVHYATPLHLQPAAVDLGYGPGSFPITERLSDSILSLPLFPGMTVEQQDRVVAEIAAFYDARDGAGS